MKFNPDWLPLSDYASLQDHAAADLDRLVCSADAAPNRCNAWSKHRRTGITCYFAAAHFEACALRRPNRPPQVLLLSELIT